MELKDGYTLVYLKHGAQVAHVLAPNASPNDYGSRALCGREPDIIKLDSWWGTGSQDEYETARIMRMCIGCASALRRQGH